MPTGFWKLERHMQVCVRYGTVRPYFDPLEPPLRCKRINPLITYQCTEMPIFGFKLDCVIKVLKGHEY